MSEHLHGERPARDNPVSADPVRDRGRPLDPSVRARMETQLGHDFGRVRVHEGDAAPAIGAKAFAAGDEVTFAPGRYRPGTPEGEALLAHELGHVADHQDGAAEPGVYRAPEGQGLPGGKERPFSFGVGPLTLGLDTLDEFAFNGFTLTDRHRERIPQLASFALSMLTKQPNGKIRVVGHTDLVGGEASNLELGQKRAREVAVALTVAGVPAASLETSSEGEGAPVVMSEQPEPRNRRVEVRFAGSPTGEAPLLKFGDPNAPAGISPGFPVGLGPGKPIFSTTPPGSPGAGGGAIGPFTPTPKTTTPPPPTGSTFPSHPDPAQREPTTRSGGAGDVLDAVTKVPEIKQALDRFADQQKAQLSKLPTGGKVALGTFAATTAAALAAGLAHDPAARTTVLDAIDGTSIPLDEIGLKGVALVPHTKGGNVGGVITFDLVKIFGGGK